MHLSWAALPSSQFLVCVFKCFMCLFFSICNNKPKLASCYWKLNITIYHRLSMYCDSTCVSELFSLSCFFSSSLLSHLNLLIFQCFSLSQEFLMYSTFLDFLLFLPLFQYHWHVCRVWFEQKLWSSLTPYCVIWEVRKTGQETWVLGSLLWNRN